MDEKETVIPEESQSAITEEVQVVVVREVEVITITTLATEPTAEPIGEFESVAENFTAAEAEEEDEHEIKVTFDHPDHPDAVAKVTVLGADPPISRKLVAPGRTRSFPIAPDIYNVVVAVETTAGIQYTVTVEATGGFSSPPASRNAPDTITFDGVDVQ